MVDEVNEPGIDEMDSETRELSDRREFLGSLGKWSTAAIAAILLIDSPSSNEASGWSNSSGSQSWWLDKSRRLRMAQQPRGRRQLG